MSRYDDLKLVKENIEYLARKRKWEQHATQCQTLKAIQSRPWCKGCGEYQRECSCDSRQEVMR